MQYQPRKIGIIQAGGTILCTPGENGKAPGVSVEEVYKTYVPQARQKILDKMHVRGETIKPFGTYGIDSSEMNSQKIEELAKAIQDNYHEYDAFVIAHGTDTMAKTSTALSFMFAQTTKPIIITGSQYAPYEKESDAGQNLGDAFEAASVGQPGVYLAFNGTIMHGTRAHKKDAESVDAFISVNKPAQTLKEFTKKSLLVPKRLTKELGFFLNKYDVKVATVEADDPEITSLAIENYFSNGCQGLIFKGYGSGNAPADVFQTLEKWVKKGKIIVMASKCELGSVDSTLYETGRRAVELGMLCGLDMATEGMKAKLKYILSNYATRGSEGKLLLSTLWYKNIAHELDVKKAKSYLVNENKIIAEKTMRETRTHLFSSSKEQVALNEV